MTKQHVEQLNALIAPAILGRFADAKLECKHFFSGAAFYANGRICMSLTPVGFALKLPEELKSKLLKEKGVKHLQYFPKGPVKKDYVVLPKSILESARTFRRLLRNSIEYALEQPAKK